MRKLKQTIKLMLRSLGISTDPKKERATRWRKRAETQLSKNDRITIDEIVSHLETAGLVKGDTLWLQSSWDTLSPHKINPAELIKRLTDVLGDEGHIMMSALVSSKDAGREVLDFRKLPSAAGMLSEVFRRWPGVVRSAQLSSVCVLGPRAEEIVEGHKNCENPFGQDTPFEFLLRENALCVSLGFGQHPTYFTPLHLVEGLHHDQIYAFRNLYGEVFGFSWIDHKGVKGHSKVRARNSTVNTSLLPHFIKREEYYLHDYSTGSLVAARLQPVIEKTFALAQQGVTIYRLSPTWCKLIRPIYPTYARLRRRYDNTGST